MKRGLEFSISVQGAKRSSSENISFACEGGSTRRNEAFPATKTASESADSEAAMS
jgi:hypothetical protein